MESEDKIQGSLGNGNLNNRSVEGLTDTLVESVNKLTKNSNSVNIINVTHKNDEIKFKSRLQSISKHNRIEMAKIAEKYNLKSFNDVLNFLLYRFKVIEEIMDYVGVRDEGKLIKLCFEYLPSNFVNLKVKIANNFLDHLRDLDLIDKEEYDKLAGLIFPILVDHGGEKK